MCSEYTTLKTGPKQIEKALGLPLLNHAGEFEWGKTVKMSVAAPILQKTDKGFELIQKIFPVSPMPNARLSGIGNQSDGNDKEEDAETQIKRVYEMSRWGEAFKTHPVLIPMSGFTEYAYWGPEVGTAQNFALPKEEVFFAAGIAMKPFMPKGLKKEDGFAILTHTATAQMLEYHHRLIVLLKAKDAAEYLEQMNPEERFDFLIAKRYTGKLEVSKIRNMAAAWKSRVDMQVAKRERELKYVKILKKESVAG